MIQSSALKVSLPPHIVSSLSTGTIVETSWEDLPNRRGILLAPFRSQTAEILYDEGVWVTESTQIVSIVGRYSFSSLTIVPVETLVS